MGRHVERPFGAVDVAIRHPDHVVAAWRRLGPRRRRRLAYRPLELVNRARAEDAAAIRRGAAAHAADASTDAGPATTTVRAAPERPPTERTARAELSDQPGHDSDAERSPGPVTHPTAPPLIFHRLTSRIRCPNSGIRSLSRASRQALGDPGSDTTILR